MGLFDDLDSWASLSPDTARARPVAAASWSRFSRVDLTADERLLFLVAADEDWLASNWVAPGRGMLEGFLALAAAPNESIRSYAERWGPLDLCRVGLPRQHVGECAGGSCKSGLSLQQDGEPVRLWRHYAGRARAIVAAAADLAHSKAPDPDAWLGLFPGRRRGAIADMLRRLPPTLSVWEFELDDVVNQWLALTDVRPRLERLAPRVRIGGNSLLGGIGLELMLTVARTDGVAFCSGCAVPFFPGRKPRSGRRTYCHSCRDDGQPARDARRDWAERRASATVVREALG